MRNTKTKLRIVMIIYLFFNYNCYSQDVHFSQYFSSPQIINPALTGQFKGDVRITSNYKNQWTAISNNSFKTSLIAVDAPFYKDKLATGLIFYNDKAGDSKMGTNSLNLSLASKIKIDSYNDLTLGIQSGFTQKTVDVSDLSWDSQYDGLTFDKTALSGESITPSNFNFFDVSSGVHWKFQPNTNVKLGLGFAAFHLNKPKLSYYNSSDRLFAKYTAKFDLEFKPNNQNITYIPTALFIKQGSTQEINVGMILKYSKGLDSKYTGANTSSNVICGVFYRVKDAAIFYAGYEYKKSLLVGLSYDVNLSNLRNASNSRGGFEISLVYKLFRNQALIK